MAGQTEAYFITSSYSRIIARELRLHERDLPALLRGTGLPLQVLQPGDQTRLSGHQQIRIIQNARAINDSPLLGLQLGRQLQPSAHGPIGYLALSSPDLLTALQALRDFLPLRIGFARLGLDLKRDWLKCTLQIRLDAPAVERRMLLECFALLLQTLVESVLGKPPAGARFELAFPAPDYQASYSEFLHAPVHFSRSHSQLVLPAGLAYTANASGDDPDAYRLAQDLCHKLLAQVPAASLSSTDQVRRLLLSRPAGAANEEDIASALFVSKRTLARRLAREGSGYRQLREQVLAELAAEHLRDSRLSVDSVAELLGYHDAANFRRACHRWFGMAPREFRQAANK